MESKKISKIVKVSVFLFLTLNMICVSYGKFQCNRMIDAIENNDITKLESILKFANPDTILGVGILDVFCENRSRRTPLGAASEVGNIEMVELLLQNGADVNYVPMNAYASPLGFAVLSNSPENTEIVELLLQNGADVNYSKHSTWQPAYKLIEGPDLPPNVIDVLEMLMEAGTDTENKMILRNACYWKHEEVIRYLVEEWGYDAADPFYLRVYCSGVDKYSYDTFEYFLKRGANPYEKNKDGKYAIGYLQEKSPEWAEKLIELAASYGITE